MAAVAAGSVAQAVTGFGFSLVCVPVLVLLVGPADAVPLGIALAMVTNLGLLAREHDRLLLADAARLLVPAVAVTPLAAYVVHRADDSVLSVVVGIAVVGCALVLATGRRATALRGRRGMVAAGAVSAAMNTTSGIGGPAVAMYALNAGWPAERSRPTLQVYFLGLNAIALLALGPVWPHPAPAAALGLALAGGLVAGVLVAARLDAAVVARAVVALALAGGTAALVRGLAGG